VAAIAMIARDAMMPMAMIARSERLVRSKSDPAACCPTGWDDNSDIAGTRNASEQDASIGTAILTAFTEQQL
jgi:hypothetical protein